VSRIDEALNRWRQQNVAVPVVAGPAASPLFEPAWDVENPPEAEAPAAVQLPAPGLPSRAPVGFSSDWTYRLASSATGDPGLVEQFRRLAGTLHKAQRATGLRSVMVTSALQGDGKTLTAINVALVLAESFNGRVLLIDADLRHPSIPSVVDLGVEVGLSDALRSSSEQRLALVPLTPRLTLLPAGQPIANSIEALTSPRMHQIIHEASQRFDWVIVDAPPVGLTTDARVLSELVGGTLFVIRAGESQHPDVERAVSSLGREHILGVVLNGTAPRPHNEYYGAPGLNPTR
jgi:protein-tyrosine kinase